MRARFTALAVCACLVVSNLMAPVHAADSQPLDLNLPSLGTVAGGSLTLSDERKIGEDMMAEIRRDYDYLDDMELQQYLNKIGYRLLAATKTQPFDFFFFPARDPSINAFAMPGGFICIYTGTLLAAHDESELAAVMAHEIGHVSQRHIARMLENNKSTLAMTLGSIALAALAALAGGNSGGDAAMAIAMGSQAALISKQLGYSRDAERESDRQGFETLVHAGFDPRGMSRFFGRLLAQSGPYESDVTQYLSTHPLTSQRITDMQNRERQYKPVTVASSMDFYLMQARARVLQSTRHDGWLKAVQFFDNDIKEGAKEKQLIADLYGKSVAYLQMGRFADAQRAAQSAVDAAGGASTAGIVLNKNLSQCTFAAATNLAAQARALVAAQSLTEKNPYSALAAASYAEMLYQAGKNDDVIRFLRRQKGLPRDSADYYAKLARSYQALGKHALGFEATGDMYAKQGNLEAAVYQYDQAQKAGDGDFYIMSEIDAKLRDARRQVLDQKKDKAQ